MNPNRMLPDPTDDEDKFLVTIYRDNAPGASLMVPRTAEELSQLWRKHRVTVTPVRNRKNPSPYREALIAVAAAHQHAQATGDERLAASTEAAFDALLRYSRQFERDSSTTMRTAPEAPAPLRQREHTIPGVGGRR